MYNKVETSQYIFLFGTDCPGKVNYTWLHYFQKLQLAC